MVIFMKTHFIGILALFLSCLWLAGCGFTPVYATGSHNKAAASLPAQLQQIDIALIPNREGQFLRNTLIDRFYTDGMPVNARYRLNIKEIEERIFDFDVTISSEATRQQLKLNTVMDLVARDTKKTVLSKNLVAISSHNILESEFSTMVTEQSAREDALNDLARQIERQLALYFANNP